MSLEQTLGHLFPLQLGGAHQADLNHDARMLEVAQSRAETLLVEMFADSTPALLVDWERMLGVLPEVNTPLQARRADIVRKIRERGGLSRLYFIEMAFTMGYAVEIEEPLPSMTEWFCAGDELMSPDVVWQWGVKISGQSLYDFRAGESCAGESLLWWVSLNVLEEVLSVLKPAHTYVYFNYEGVE